MENHAVFLRTLGSVNGKQKLSVAKSRDAVPANWQQVAFVLEHRTRTLGGVFVWLLSSNIN